MIINTHPADRRRMIHELSDLLNTPAEYLRSPTYGYRIGHLIVNRDGTISTEVPHMVEVVRPFLLEHHYLIEETQAETETPLPAPIVRRAMRIAAELGEPTAFQLTQLLLILYCRQYILNRMLKTTELFIDHEFVRELESDIPASIAIILHRFEKAQNQGKISGISLTDNSITLELPLESQNPDHVPVYNELLRRLVAMAHSIKGVQVGQHVPDSEKYTARAFLIRLGFNGKDHRDARNVLLHHLDGYAAFRRDADMNKHNAKLARQRRETATHRSSQRRHG